jgi:hypothetical protein
MTTPEERAERDVTMRQLLADRQSLHQEVVAAAELDRSYVGSALVGGSANDRLGPGALLPDALGVQTGSGEARDLHELGDGLAHTVFVVGGEGISAADVLEVTTRIGRGLPPSPLFGEIFGFSAESPDDRIGRIDAVVADQLGIDSITILAVRPDRFVGFRSDEADVAALASYFDAFTK